jgi:hypothetical protein
LVEQLKILNEALGLAVGGVGKNFKTGNLGVAPSLRRPGRTERWPDLARELG